MRTLLASLALLTGATAGAQQLDPNITRIYYLGDLENCPGKLDMQPGDLWTLTFPDTVTDAFVTRNGIVERQIQGNRLIMAVTAQTGTTPALVLTEDGQAPRFNITVAAGKGGRNKNVVIRPGLPPGGSKCKVATSTPAPKAATVPAVTPPAAKPAAKPPVVTANPAPRAPTPPTVTVRPPVPVTPVSGQAITVKAPVARPVTPSASTPVTANLVRTVPAEPAQVVPALTAAPVQASVRKPVTVAANAPGYLRVRVTSDPAKRTHLTFTFANTLDADVILQEADLRVAGARGRGAEGLLIPAGGELTSQVALEGPLPELVGHMTWPGTILGSGETFEVRAVLVL